MVGRGKEIALRAYSSNTIPIGVAEQGRNLPITLPLMDKLKIANMVLWVSDTVEKVATTSRALNIAWQTLARESVVADNRLSRYSCRIKGRIFDD
jgi:hypothetical protein